jgi:hypothetical protein
MASISERPAELSQAAYATPLSLSAVLRMPSHTLSAGHVARRDWSVAAVALITAVVGLVALYLSYRANDVLAYQDASSHLNIARRVLDSRSPGVAQFGTIWLPIPHLLLQPFVASDYLWRTGLAGSIVGFGCFEVTAITLFLSIRLIARRQFAAWIGLAVFLSNPNMLYLQTTALTEPVMLMTMTASAYFLLRWNVHDRQSDLVLAGLLGIAAVGSRYDGWFFVIVCSFLVALSVRLRWRDRARAEGITLVYLVLPFYGMFLWFFYNWLIFGSPLAFQQGQSSEIALETQSPVSGLILKHHLLSSVRAYGWATIDNLGLVVTLLGLAGLVLFVINTRFRAGSLAPYAFLSSFPFNVITLFFGQSIILVHQLTPDHMFNVRYGIMMLPGMTLFIGYLADWLLTHTRPALVAPLLVLALLGQGMLWIPGWPGSAVSLADGLSGGGSGASSDELRSALPAYLRGAYQGGGILIDDVAFQQYILLRTGLPMRDYIGSNNGGLWEQALQDPSRYAAWVVMHATFSPTRPDRLTAAFLGNATFLGRYRLVLRAYPYVVYQRVSGQ